MIKIDDISTKVIEPAKTGRSKCKICNNTIEKNTLRIGISYAEQSGLKWHHLTCFPVKDIVTSPDDLEGYTTLTENEQNSVKDQMNVTIAPIRCSYGDKFIDPTNMEELNETEKNEISSIKSKIEEIKIVTAEKLRELLVENGQYSTGTKGELLVRAADVIVRGTIPKCSKCEKGFLHWSESTQDYFCKGSTDEEGNNVKCDAIFTKEEINRTPCVIPETFWQKKERKRKVTATTVVEKVDDDNKKKQEEEEEEDTGMRKKRKSAGVRKWNEDFIYDKDQSEDNESVEDQDNQDQPYEENENNQNDDNQNDDNQNENNQNDNNNNQIHQNNHNQNHYNNQNQNHQNPTSNPYFNTVINYNNNNNNNNENQNYYGNDY